MATKSKTPADTATSKTTVEPVVPVSQSVPVEPAAAVTTTTNESDVLPTAPVTPDATAAPAVTETTAGTTAPANSKPDADSATSGAGDSGIEDAAAIAAALAVSPDAVSDPHAVASNEELAELASRAVGFKGLDENLNPPTMVNGVSVAGKKHDAATDTWVTDPDSASATERKQDLIDRIARAFPNEGQRLVLEELCRLITDPENTTELPDGQPTGDKSTGSLRHDAAARGIVAKPVAPAVE